MPRLPTVISKIKNVQHFKAVLDTLRHDLSDAHDHYTLFRNLLAAKEGEYTKAVSQSQTFWSLVYRANLDAAVFRLCRVYDQEKNALTLRSLLETIQSRPRYLPSPSVPLKEMELDGSLKWASHESNPVVKNLMIWRHKVYAHRDVEKAISGDMVAYPITHDDIRALLDKGFEIVNRYGVAFFRDSLLRDVMNSNDYLKVLRTLQNEVEGWEATFRAVAEQAKQET